jgi:hypothetical protein
MKPRKSLPDRNEAGLQVAGEAVDDDTLSLAEVSVGNQPMQFVMGNVDEASPGRSIGGAVFNNRIGHGFS